MNAKTISRLDKIIGKKLRILRVENELTQSQLAEMLGCGQRTISTWERGECSIPSGKLKIICQTLGVKITYFL